MKKMFTLFLAIFLVVGILAACSEQKSSSNEEKEGEPSEPVTIKVHTYGTNDVYKWEKTVSAFKKKHPDINVEIVELSEKNDSQEALKKIDLGAASGEEMDVIMFPFIDALAQRAQLGMVEELDKYIQADGINMEKEYKFDLKVNDHYYAMPGKFNLMYVLLNKDRLDAAGLEVPKEWTWDEFQEYAKKLTGDGYYGTYFHGPFQFAWQQYMSLNLITQESNAGFLKVDGSSNMNDPLYKKSLELRVKMEKEDKSAVPYSQMISQKLNYRDQFFTQASSMIVTGSWLLSELGGSDRFPVEFNIAVAPMPKNNPTDEFSYNPTGGDLLGIYANSKHKDASYKFIKWYSTEGQFEQAAFLPSWTKASDAEIESLIDQIFSESANPDKLDRETLLHTIKSTKSAKISQPVPYINEINAALTVEFEKLILDQQDVDTTVANSKKIVQDIIDKNK
ncbi:multiple sugar transport system substrate-binding protein [Neobacillus niacini]|uniref:ABC transporter substrate-binding protein n=1 Tax=Neobacillus niacini TaxID=86668 RepID=UPI00285BDC80|nr:extracellular solute-binding protein [Neobacillus niacini]MDR7075619.1 multiple sugar transport system substrate-binding protein [Neobacillus niacini]